MGKSLSSCSCKSLALSVMVVLQVTIFASLFGRSACVLQRADEDSKIIVQSSPLNADSVLHRSTLVEQSLPLFGTAVLTTLHAPRSAVYSPLLHPISLHTIALLRTSSATATTPSSQPPTLSPSLALSVTCTDQ